MYRNVQDAPTSCVTRSNDEARRTRGLCEEVRAAVWVRMADSKVAKAAHVWKTKDSRFIQGLYRIFTLRFHFRLASASRELQRVIEMFQVQHGEKIQ